MNTRYKSKTAEWVRRAVLAVLLAVLLFALGRCIYRNRTVAEMNEYVTAFAYKGETYTYIEPACGYVQGTQIGKTQNGYRLFRVEGDDGDAVFDCPTSRPGGRPDMPLQSQGAEIPDGGTVSSIVIGRTATADERIMHTVQTLVEAAPTEALACDEAGTDRMKLYFCFEGCPVSNRFAGTFWYVDQQAWYYESNPKSGALTPVTDESLVSFLEEQRISWPWSWFE